MDKHIEKLIDALRESILQRYGTVVYAKLFKDNSNEDFVINVKRVH